jgi:hypothetical protein
VEEGGRRRRLLRWSGGQQPRRRLDDDDRGTTHAGGERWAVSDRIDAGATVRGHVSEVPGTRSPNAATCPYFRSLGADGLLGPPLEAPDPVNRCAASGEIVPQSYRQQELVCLTTGHVNCPRFVRGSELVRRGPMARPIPLRTVGRATGASLLVLAGSFVVTFGFLLTRGTFALPALSPGATEAAVVDVVPSPTATPRATAASPSPSATPSVEPTGGVAPTATTSPSPASTPRPTPRPTQRSDRYDLLERCPQRPRCWIYTVRSGDNLSSIANYFGIPLETVRDLNPWTRTRGLRAGQELILPPPTR